MKKHLRDLIDVARDYGATDVHVEKGGRHPFICGTLHGTPFRRAVVGTPSDRRSFENSRTSLIRAMHRTMGKAVADK